MADMRSKLNEIYSLEQLSNKNTVIHKIHPMIKIIVTIVYIVCLLMKDRYDLFGLAVFLFYPIIVMALAEIPYKMIFKRTLVTLPFVFFAGIGSLIFDREEVVLASGVVVTTGVLAFFVLHVRTILSVSAVLLLVSTTKFSDLTKQLGRMHVPIFMIHLMEMIYRYISVLVDEEAGKSTIEGLKSAEGYVRRELASRINLRNTPQVKFILDQSIEYGVNMSRLIDEVTKDLHHEEEEE